MPSRVRKNRLALRDGSRSVSASLRHRRDRWLPRVSRFSRSVRAASRGGNPSEGNGRCFFLSLPPRDFPKRARQRVRAKSPGSLSSFPHRATSVFSYDHGPPEPLAIYATTGVLRGPVVFIEDSGRNVIRRNITPGDLDRSFVFLSLSLLCFRPSRFSHVDRRGDAVAL